MFVGCPLPEERSSHLLMQIIWSIYRCISNQMYLITSVQKCFLYNCFLSLKWKRWLFILPKTYVELCFCAELRRRILLKSISPYSDLWYWSCRDAYFIILKHKSLLEFLYKDIECRDTSVGYCSELNLRRCYKAQWW